MVDGYQNGDPAKPGSVMASVKHFALYGAVEGGRDYNTVDMSPLRMYQDYLPPYKAAVDAGSGGVMVSLNSVNGVPATANPWLLKDLLRDQWGFKGITISDHGAIKELIKHGVAPTRATLYTGNHLRRRHEHERRVLRQIPAGSGERRAGA